MYRSTASFQDGVYSESNLSFTAPDDFNTNMSTSFRGGYLPETSSSYKTGGRKVVSSGSFESLMYHRNAELDGRGKTTDYFIGTKPERRIRVPFLHRPPGQSTLSRFDSVSSLNTNGSFYQAGSLDDLPGTLEDEMEDDVENKWVGAQEEDDDDDDSDGDGEKDEPNETTSENEDNSTVVGSAHSRTNSPSSASAFGGNEDYQSEWDSDTTEGHESGREDNPTPPNYCVLGFSCSESISAPLHSTQSISVTTPYKTRSGQVPGSYVGKHVTPKHRRAWGESISANP